jgi:hypothetical protein
VPVVLKPVSLNFLDPSGPFKACHGIALSLPLDVDLIYSKPIGAQVVFRLKNNKVIDSKNLICLI